MEGAEQISKSVQDHGNGRSIWFNKVEPHPEAGSAAESQPTSEPAELYRQLFLKNPLPMLVYDIATLRILMVSSSAIAHYQYTEEEFLNLTVLDIRPEEKIEEYYLGLRELQKGNDITGYTCHRKKNGEIIEVQVVCMRILFNGTEAVLVLVTDITEQKRAEMALQESQQRYKSLAEQNPNSVVSLDLNGCIAGANQAFSNLMECPVEDLLKRPYYQLADAPMASRCLRQLRDAVQGNANNFNACFLTSRNRKIIVNITLIPIVVGHNISGAFAIIKDRTRIFKVRHKLKQSHKELRALAAHIVLTREEERKRIAREIHDELGQVLTALKIDLSLLRNKATEVEQEVLREDLDECIEIMRQTTDEAIQSVKKIVAELRPIALDELGLRQEIQHHSAKFQARFGIKINLQIRPGRIPVKRGSEIEIFRIMQEALTNVARHAEATEVTIKSALEGKELVISISDNGVGITSIRSSNRQKSFGLLGMRERAHMIGGNLTVKKRPEGGTLVELRIPADMSE